MIANISQVSVWQRAQRHFRGSLERPRTFKTNYIMFWTHTLCLLFLNHRVSVLLSGLIWNREQAGSEEGIRDVLSELI